MRRRLDFAAAVIVLVGMTAGGQAQPRNRASDWPQWRGPARDGTLFATLPAEWSEQLTKRWEVPVGAGHSSPVIAGTRVVVLARQGDREIVRALDISSGRQLWQADYQTFYSVNPAAAVHGPGPKSTPAIATGRVFTLGIGGVLSAFEVSTGKLVWRTPAPSGLPEYGTAMSPLVDGNVAIAHVGGFNNGAITAFDTATGKPRWRWTGDGHEFAHCRWRDGDWPESPQSRAAVRGRLGDR
jgi:outer membrane protein assembly factor BamB